MAGPVGARGGRMLGRGLLTVANVILVAAPFAADWNDSHIFHERWPAHARFHGVTALAMAATLSSANIWSIWSRASDRTTARFFAAAVPVACWAPFFLAPLVRGTAVDNPPHPVPAPGRRADESAGRGSYHRDGGSGMVHCRRSAVAESG